MYSLVFSLRHPPADLSDEALSSHSAESNGPQHKESPLQPVSRQAPLQLLAGVPVSPFRDESVSGPRSSLRFSFWD